jgi:sugar phosphate isomerase/epimerase
VAEAARLSPAVPPTTRRRFISHLPGAATAIAFPWAARDLFAIGANSLAPEAGPSVQFPAAPRERLAIASYPFRDFIAGLDSPNSSAGKMDIKDFAAHVAAKFNVNKIEPWSRHFRSVDRKYLDEVRAGVEKVHGLIVDIAADSRHSQYSTDRAERDKAVQFGKQWIDVAAIVGSPSVRTNIPGAKDTKPDVSRAAESLRLVAEHAAVKKVVVHLENDNPVSEDPFFIVEVVEKVNSPWLHALPDFANSLTTGNEEHAYKGIDAMFAHAYGICHIKAMEANDAGQVFKVDMPKTFAILKAHNYKGYCSMEYDSPGNPYRGTQDLIDTTLQYLT